MQKLITLLRKEIGYQEQSGGYTKFGDWYNAVETDADYSYQPWCDMFLSWGANKLGYSDWFGEFSYTVAHAEWFQAQGAWGHKPQPGAVVFFDWDGGGSVDGIDHVGLVTKVDGSQFTSIEGNTSNMVQERTHDEGTVVGFGYPEQILEKTAGEPETGSDTTTDTGSDTETGSDGRPDTRPGMGPHPRPWDRPDTRPGGNSDDKPGFDGRPGHGSDTGSGPRQGIGADTDSGTTSGTGSDTESGTDSGTNTGTNTGAGPDTDSDAKTGTDTSRGTGPGAHIGSDARNGTDTGANTGPGSHALPKIGIGASPDTRWGGGSADEPGFRSGDGTDTWSSPGSHHVWSGIGADDTPGISSDSGSPAGVGPGGCTGGDENGCPDRGPLVWADTPAVVEEARPAPEASRGPIPKVILLKEMAAETPLVHAEPAPEISTLPVAASRPAPYSVPHAPSAQGLVAPLLVVLLAMVFLANHRRPAPAASKDYRGRHRR
ncbi:CHAP domain-containing protein [Herbidospora galbida]|nr:CHAP domain-containing protein [Herbidospora galbida]